jgi:hypothetical protein
MAKGKGEIPESIPAVDSASTAASEREAHHSMSPPSRQSGVTISRIAAIAAATVVSLPLLTTQAAAECTDGIIQTGDVGDPGDCVECVPADCVDPGDTDTLDYSGDELGDSSCSDACGCGGCGGGDCGACGDEFGS